MSLRTCIECEMYAIEGAKHIVMHSPDTQGIWDRMFDNIYGAVHGERDIIWGKAVLCFQLVHGPGRDIPDLSAYQLLIIQSIYSNIRVTYG